MKTEAPTEAKLDSLREQGIVPISSFASHCAGLASAIVVIAMALKELSPAVPISCSDLFDCQQLFTYLSRLLRGTLLFPLAAYVLIYFSVSIIQSRGYFRVIFTRSRFGERWNALHLKAIVGFFLCGIVVVGAGSYMYPKLCSEIFAMPSSYLMTKLSQQLLSRLFIFAGITGVLSCCAWIFGHLLFMREHRMTREEIQREARQ